MLKSLLAVECKFLATVGCPETTVQSTARMAQHHFQKVNWAIQVPAVSETALVHSKLVAEGSGLSQYLLLVSHGNIYERQSIAY